MRKISICLLLILLAHPSSVFSWELFDRVVAIVNKTPIIESEVLNKFNRFLKIKRIPRKKRVREKSRILDRFIEDAIVVQKAEEESIIVSNKKIDIHIEKIMKRAKISSLKDFKKRIAAKEKITFDKYKEELKISLIREQVLTIAIGVSPPTIKDARIWFSNNRKKLGYQVRVKHILIRPRNRSIAEEKRVNNLINKIRRSILSGKSFESQARKYSQDPDSAGKGGDLGWVLLAELDPYFASRVFRMRKSGQISRAIKSSYGYHLVKYLGRRNTPFEAVKNRIFHLLFQKKLSVQFKKWVLQRKRESEIKIYMEDYIKG